MFYTVAASDWRPFRVNQRGDGTSYRNDAIENVMDRKAKIMNGKYHKSEESIITVL